MTFFSVGEVTRVYQLNSYVFWRPIFCYLVRDLVEIKVSANGWQHETNLRWRSTRTENQLIVNQLTSSRPETNTIAIACLVLQF